MVPFKVIVLTVLLVCQCQGRPQQPQQQQQQPVLSHLEAAKQPRLVRFPDIHDAQSEAKTKQILVEIDRINQQLGYVKKTTPAPVTRPPVESYFFPRDRRHFAPSSQHQNHQHLQVQEQSNGQLLTPSQNHNYLIIPFPFQFLVPPPNEQQFNSGREHRRMGDFGKFSFFRNWFGGGGGGGSSTNLVKETSKQFDLNSIEPPLITFLNDAFRSNYTFSLPPSAVFETTTVPPPPITSTIGTSTTEKPKDKDPDLIDAIIDEVIDDDESAGEDEEEEDDDDDEEEDDDDEEASEEVKNKNKKKVPSEYQNISINKYINNLYKNSLITPKAPQFGAPAPGSYPPPYPPHQNHQQPNKTTTLLNYVGSASDWSTQFASATTTEKTRIFNPIKRIQQEYNRRKTQQQYQQFLQQHQHQQVDKESVISSSGEKSPFGLFRPAESALKEGGIVIQRLRVRQGGIAIAGAGGVATAGSGGTAIVGPGGLVLSHPRSLSIVGPGARVLSVPPSVDLSTIIEAQAKGRSLPFIEGAQVVATGPAVYYNPGMR